MPRQVLGRLLLIVLLMSAPPLLALTGTDRPWREHIDWFEQSPPFKGIYVVAADHLKEVAPSAKALSISMMEGESTEALKTARSLETLVMYKTDLSDEAATALKSKLKSLTLLETHVSRECLAALGGGALEELTIQGGSIPDNPWNSIAAMKSLKKLTVLKCESPFIESPADDTFAALSNLEELRINGQDARTIGVGFAESLGKLPKLRSLSLRDFSEIEDSAFEAIAKCSALTHLDLSGWSTDHFSLDTLAGMTSLESLSLAAVKGLDAAALKTLASLSKLRALDLRSWAVSDAEFDELEHFSRLEVLNLSECKLSEAKHLKPLRKLTNLKVLHLNQTWKADVPKEVSYLKSLTRLGVNGWPLEISGNKNKKKAALNDLKKLKSLTHIDLGGDKRLPDNLERKPDSKHLGFLKGMDSLRVLAMRHLAVEGEIAGRLPDSIREIDLTGAAFEHGEEGLIVGRTQLEVVISIGNPPRRSLGAVSSYQGLYASHIESITSLPNLRILDVRDHMTIDVNWERYLRKLKSKCVFLHSNDMPTWNQAFADYVGRKKREENYRELSPINKHVVTNEEYAPEEGLGRFKELEILEIQSNKGDGARLLPTVANPSLLKSLTLKIHVVNDALLQSVASFTKLSELKISLLGEEPVKGVSTEGFMSLAAVKGLRWLEFAGADNLGDVSAVLYKWKNLQHLELSRVLVDAKVLTALEGCKDLRFISFFIEGGLSVEGIASLLKMKKLEHIAPGSLSASVDEVLKLKALPNLEKFDTSLYALPLRDRIRLAEHFSIESQSLVFDVRDSCTVSSHHSKDALKEFSTRKGVHFDQVDENTLRRVLTSFDNLEHVSFYIDMRNNKSIRHFESKHAELLASVRRLTSVGLSYTNEVDQAFCDTLKRSTTLKQLSFHLMEMTMPLAETLANWKGLKNLTLSHLTGVEAKHLAVIARNPTITRLYLTGINNTERRAEANVMLEGLRNWKHLEVLGLTYFGKGLGPYLSPLSNLHTLFFDGVVFDNKDSAAIAKLPKLREFNAFVDEKVEEEFLPPLAESSSLKTVRVWTIARFSGTDPRTFPGLMAKLKARGIFGIDKPVTTRMTSYYIYESFVD